MGFNNDGVKVIAERVRKFRKHKASNSNAGHRTSPIIIGGNIGKNKVTPNADAWKDYEICFNELDDIIDLALEIKLDGLVAANTTISRINLISPKEKVEAIGAGGLSGKPLNEKSNRITHHIHLKTKGAIPIISSGGIFTSFDAQEKFERGASLVQVWTGFIYEGPGIVKKICNGIR